MTMRVTKKIAKTIMLEDDYEQEHGGIAFIGETLADFMESVRPHLPYGSSLTKVNKGLIECGIMPVTINKK